MSDRARRRVHISVCVALLIQHKTCMRHVLKSFVATLAPLYFSTLSHKRHDFRGKRFKHKIVFLFSIQLLSKIFLIRRLI